MESLNEFLEIEINSVTKRRILDTIDDLQNSTTEEQREFTFNVYSVMLMAKEKKVLIFNDILPDLPDIEFSFGEFRDLLLNFRPRS